LRFRPARVTFGEPNHHDKGEPQMLSAADLQRAEIRIPRIEARRCGEGAH